MLFRKINIVKNGIKLKVKYLIKIEATIDKYPMIGCLLRINKEINKNKINNESRWVFPANSNIMSGLQLYKNKALFEFVNLKISRELIIFTPSKVILNKLIKRLILFWPIKFNNDPISKKRGP